MHCPLGAERRSKGEHDENTLSLNLAGVSHDDNPDGARRLGKARYGFACRKDKADKHKVNAEYEWKHCLGIHVEDRYELHRAHSALSAYGTFDQYKDLFLDGVSVALQCSSLENSFRRMSLLQWECKEKSSPSSTMGRLLP